MQEKDQTINRSEAIFKLVLETNIELRMIKKMLIDQQTSGMTESERSDFVNRYNAELKKQSQDATDFLLGKANL